MKIAALQMVSTPSVERNLESAQRLIAEAAAAGAFLVALPEYFCFMGRSDRDKLTIAEAPGIDLELADALYSIMHRQWDAYDDVLPVLEALRDRGVRVAMLSNVGFDLTPTLERTGVGALIDGAVMSYAVGVVKPDPGIFQRALEVLDLPASEVLMVGDAWRDDAGAAALGVRTLILPRTDDPSHGLELVLRLV